ncbi:MAG: hypothetical protein QNJ43_18255 [Breoghania sp.]|nr:hypothetical protein [Breoghania sp.]MDJ0932434.1 hypothetical protein [Breoghania sp.]
MRGSLPDLRRRARGRGQHPARLVRHKGPDDHRCGGVLGRRDALAYGLVFWGGLWWGLASSLAVVAVAAIWRFCMRERLGLV